MRPWVRLALVALLVVAGVAYWQRVRVVATAATLREFFSTAHERLGLVAGVSVVMGAVAYYVQVQVPEIPANARIAWLFDAKERGIVLALGVACTAVALGLPLLTAKANRSAATASRAAVVAAVEEQQLELHGLFNPLATLLGRVSDADPTDEPTLARLQGEVKQVALQGVVQLLKRDSRVRSCYFGLDESGPSRRLVPDGTAGRADGTTLAFIEGTPEGNEALQALDDEQARFWRLGENPVPPGWTSDKKYRAFISVPVATKSRVHGMLTVDARDADAFNFDADVPTVELLARLLASALSASDKP